MHLMLDKDELKRRIDAFRTLRGLTQVELAELFASKGHGTQELGRLERGVLPLTEIRRRSLAEILDVPEHWFEDDAELLPGRSGGSEEPQLTRIEHAVADITRREERAQQDRDAITALLAQQSKILLDIAGLLTRQEEILTEMQRVAKGLPGDENLRMLNDAARQLTELAQAGPAAPSGSEAAPADSRRRAAGGS
jgi:transcriptional regulator with XRE-family HTH domain